MTDLLSLQEAPPGSDGGSNRDGPRFTDEETGEDKNASEDSSDSESEDTRVSRVY